MQHILYELTLIKISSSVWSGRCSTALLHYLSSTEISINNCFTALLYYLSPTEIITLLGLAEISSLECINLTLSRFFVKWHCYYVIKSYKVIKLLSCIMYISKYCTGRIVCCLCTVHVCVSRLWEYIYDDSSILRSILKHYYVAFKWNLSMSEIWFNLYK